jgi:hypothetical protein
LIRVENPIAVALLVGALVLGVGVFPFFKTKRFRLTASKAAALVIVLGFCVYQRSLLPSLIFLWPLSFIWYPEFWGNFTGYLRGPSIDEKSPPVVVSAFGWFFLIVFPILLMWIAKR